MKDTRPLDMWEAAWAPYDQDAYQTALSYITPNDIVLDIGAGDLRLARQAAQMARQVFAIECQPGLLSHDTPLPDNLTVICADARRIPWPKQITVALLLMRHCTHVGLYAARLRALGCRRLITNARWGLDVELVTLNDRLPWAAVKTGCYACLCGQTGFIPGPSQQITAENIWHTQEVESCPACDPVGEM